MAIRKDPFLVRSYFLPDTTQYSVPQVAGILGMSRANAREVIFGRVAEHLADPNKENPALVFSSTNRGLEAGDVEVLTKLLEVLETIESVESDLRYETEKISPCEETIKVLNQTLEMAQQTREDIRKAHPDLLINSATIAKKLEGRPVLSQAGIDVLLAVEASPTDQLAVNVRVRAGRKLLSPGSGRPFIGWSREFSDEEANLSTSRWWPELTRHDVVGLPFIVTLSGFVVKCGRIDKRLRNDNGRVGYEVDWSDESIKRNWFGKRVPNKQGATIGFIND